MKDRAVRLRKIARAGDTLQLAPGLTAGMAVGADVAAPEPAVIGAIVIWTKVLRGVDGASASPGKDEQGRWRAGGLGTRFGSLLTSFT